MGNFGTSFSLELGQVWVGVGRSTWSWHDVSHGNVFPIMLDIGNVIITSTNKDHLGPINIFSFTYSLARVIIIVI